jgi:hypothetical protein
MDCKCVICVEETYSVKTFSIKTLSIMTLSIMIHIINGFFETLSINEPTLQHECCYAVCCYAGCRIFSEVMLNVIVLGAIMMLSLIWPNQHQIKPQTSTINTFLSANLLKIYCKISTLHSKVRILKS